jgi:hypothetical protein
MIPPGIELDLMLFTILLLIGGFVLIIVPPTTIALVR